MKAKIRTAWKLFEIWFMFTFFLSIFFGGFIGISLDGCNDSSILQKAFNIWLFFVGISAIWPLWLLPILRRFARKYIESEGYNSSPLNAIMKMDFQREWPELHKLIFK